MDRGIVHASCYSGVTRASCKASGPDRLLRCASLRVTALLTCCVGDAALLQRVVTFYNTQNPRSATESRMARDKCSIASLKIFFLRQM